jgi:hypothetical protein
MVEEEAAHSMLEADEYRSGLERDVSGHLYE